MQTYMHYTVYFTYKVTDYFRHSYCYFALDSPSVFIFLPLPRKIIERIWGQAGSRGMK